MTTTAFDDQFTPATQTIESVHAPYEPVAILKRNVAELELALKRQTERAEKTGAELTKLREQKPVFVAHLTQHGVSFSATEINTDDWPDGDYALYAAPVPAAPYGVDAEAANRIALAVYDCKNGINPEPLLYAINRILGEEVHLLSVEGRDALLQSAEVHPDDKWQLTPAPTHPADRDAREVRHD